MQEKKQILKDDFQIQMTKRLEREVTEMCNLSKGVEEKGRKKGRQEGREEGRKEERKEERVASINSLMKNLKLSLQEAMNVLEIPESEQAEYVEILENK